MLYRYVWHMPIFTSDIPESGDSKQRDIDGHRVRIDQFGSETFDGDPIEPGPWYVLSHIPDRLSYIQGTEAGFTAYADAPAPMGKLIGEYEDFHSAVKAATQP